MTSMLLLTFMRSCSFVFSFSVAFPVALWDLFKCKVHYKLNVLLLLLLLLLLFCASNTNKSNPLIKLSHLTRDKYFLHELLNPPCTFLQSWGVLLCSASAGCNPLQWRHSLQSKHTGLTSAVSMYIYLTVQLLKSHFSTSTFLCFGTDIVPYWFFGSAS